VTQIGAGVQAGTSLLDMFAQASSAKQQERLLDLQQGQEEIQSEQQGIARARQVRQVTAQATAQAAASGVSVASASVQAVNRSSFDAFQQDNDIEALNISLSKARTAAQKSMIEQKEYSGMFGDFLSIAGSIAMIAML
jgi:hypothetical protein